MPAAASLSTPPAADPGLLRAVHNAPGILWAALTEDSGAAVTVYDPDGTIRQLNASARTLLGATAEVGRNLRELFAAEVADERVGIIRSVVTGSEPVVMDSITRGELRRSTFRQVAGDGRGQVLEVSRPGAGGTSEGVRPIRARHDDLGLLGSLTAREREILGLIGEGMSTAEIAEHLKRSAKTVEWHRVSLGAKLGAGNRVELARIALRAGLTTVRNGTV